MVHVVHVEDQKKKKDLFLALQGIYITVLHLYVIIKEFHSAQTVENKYLLHIEKMTNAQNATLDT